MNRSMLIFCSIILVNCSEDNQTNYIAPQQQDSARAITWYRPALTATWQWQLTGSVNTSYKVELYDIDLFDTPNELIQQIHQSGSKVICYFSAGTYESNRADAGAFAQADLGATVDGWPDERWLDIRSSGVRQIMRDRLDLAKQKNCDGVEPDNVDAYSNSSGFNLTGEDQLDFNRFLATQAHLRNLAVGLKNDIEQIPALVDYFDFAINEQCHEYNECAALQAFIRAQKPVLNAEYIANPNDSNELTRKKQLCNLVPTEQFRILILSIQLDDSFRISCDD